MRSTWAEQVWAVVRKDIVIEARSRVNTNAMIFFAGAVVLVFSFALGPNRAHLQAASGGILWLAFIFAGVLAFGRIYQLEAENNAFELLIAVARNRGTIYLGKLIGATVVMLVIEIIVLPLMAILYNLDLAAGAIPLLLLTGVLGTVGFASIGALYGALTMSLRAREVLLPVLLLPVTVPVILGAVKTTTYVLTSQYGDLRVWLELLVAFDIVFVTAGLLTFEYAVGE